VPDRWGLINSLTPGNKSLKSKVVTPGNNMREKFLEQWLLNLLNEKPELLTDAKTQIGFYAGLYDIWTKDIQEVTKTILIDLKKKL
jgi:hypothetical protein